MEIDELFSVGMVILLGLLGGKLSHRVGIPKVTGYMIVGLVFGPSVIGLISDTTLSDIHMINDIALGMILFAIGGEVDLNRMRAVGRQVILIAAAESLGAMTLVFLIVLAITGDYGLAVLLGSISIATAPGVTLLVVREYRTRGTLTEHLLAVVALNNIFCLVVFRLFFALYSYLHGEPGFVTLASLAKEMAGSIIIGGTIGAMITYWEQKIDDLSELLLVIIGGLLLGIGLSKTFGISYLIVCLIIGAVTNNLSMMHRLVYAELRQTEMPFYIAFFVLSGASLHLNSMAHLGLLGIAYLVTRPLGKYLGAYLAGRKLGAPDAVTNLMGMALLPQAGVAIGMVLTVSEVNPDLGRVIGTVILSSVIVYEGVGPFLTRLALSRAHEIYLKE
ncbi:MAG TPA: cation:proton antiporter [candidate division Zixibacteria bacterium]|nr:cation:proton antiporter [candidate division Zixibacteria bacterium]